MSQIFILKIIIDFFSLSVQTNVLMSVHVWQSMDKLKEEATLKAFIFGFLLALNNSESQNALFFAISNWRWLLPKVCTRFKKEKIYENVSKKLRKKKAKEF